MKNTTLGTSKPSLENPIIDPATWPSEQEAAEANAARYVGEVKAVVEAGHRVYRRKPLLVAARLVQLPGLVETALGPMPAELGDWVIEEGGQVFLVRSKDFANLYEEAHDAQPVGVGEPEYPLGTRIDQDGKRLIRVEVVSGQGNIAYWYRQKPNPEMAEFKVIADQVDNVGASHRAGKFLAPFEGKAGGRVWVVMGK